MSTTGLALFAGRSLLNTTIQPSPLLSVCLSVWCQWKDGHVSGTVYSGEDELMDLMGQATALCSISNPLHPDIFPSLMKLEVCKV